MNGTSRPEEMGSLRKLCEYMQGDMMKLLEIAMAPN
jgi:hypothetical protein